MAANLADEVKIGGTANPEMVPLMRKWVSEGETAAGRSKNAVGIVAGAVTVVDEDGRLARAKARREVVMYLDVVGGFDPTFAFPPGLLEQIRHELLISGADGAAKLVPDEVLDRFAFAGTPDAVAQHALEVLDAGAARIDFGTPHGTSDDHGLELLGRGCYRLSGRRRAGDPGLSLELESEVAGRRSGWPSTAMCPSGEPAVRPPGPALTGRPKRS